MKGAVGVVCVVLVLFVVGSLQQSPVEYARLPRGFSAYHWADKLSTPRGIFRLPNNDMLVLERGTSRITLLFDEGNKGYSGPNDRVVLATQSGINHAVIFVLHPDSQTNGSILASAANAVYRWNYTLGSRALLGAPEVLINNIPVGGHVTRTLEFDPEMRLYVSIGSETNVDRNSIRARIVRFNDIWSKSVRLPIDWTSGELYADGLRNEAGFRFFRDNMWGVENGVDNLNRPDLGGDIHTDNPCEEFNLLPDRNSKVGGFYGYPYCWSEYSLPKQYSQGAGIQWCQLPFCNDSTHTDDWCRNVENVKPPSLCLPAHIAPLDVVFYEKHTKGNWPIAEGDAFVASHGSWNREPAQGYKVYHIKFENSKPHSFSSLFEYQGPGDKGPNWAYRPVALQFANCGTRGDCLLVTSDATNDIIAIVHQEQTN